jgi:poly-gamma-glutamate synthesis protein (capsule biosynthesis protein)
LANNHALQHGEAALKGTIELLDRRGIKYVGVRGCNSAVFDFGFTKIGFLGYCSDQQYEKANIFVEPIDLAGLSRDVQELKRSGINFIVVSLHWGGEFVHRPSPSQIDLGRSIIEMGANLVLGHHSHVIQGIETYKGGTIVYSLGNFISDMRWNRHLERTMIALCEISALGDITVKPIPVRLNRFFQPEPATGREGEEISSRVDILSRELNRFDLKRPLYTESGYRSEVKRRKNINRLGMYRHFISHLHKYGRGTPHEILRFFLWKKIDKVIWAGKRLFAKSKTIP